MNLTSVWCVAVLARPSSRSLPANLANLRLRTKLLLSFVLVSDGLTRATLLVVRRSAQVQMQHQVEQDARNATLMFQVMEQQHQMALSRKADLLASLTYMRNGDTTAIKDASEDPWKSDDCDMFALADKKGKIVALHSTTSEFPTAAAQEMLRRSAGSGSVYTWWINDKNIYQVVLQRFYDGPPVKSNLLGTVVVGRSMDVRAASDLGRISSSQIIFRYGKDVVVSTLSALQEQEVIGQIQDQPTQEQIYIGNERFLTSVVDLTPGTLPTANVIILKSYKEAAASLAKLNRLLLGLGLIAVLAGGALVYVISETITRPLAALLEGVQALKEGNFAYPIEAHGGDELAEVTRAFDGMRGTLQRNEAQREQLEEQLRQAQKMEALGRLAGGVAHDFNNLLTVINGHSELLIDPMKPSEDTYSSTQQSMNVDEACAQERPPLKPGRYVQLVVTDNGHGMDAATKSRIFEPFFTTKESGKGTGLGLATVYGVVRQSGGFIWVETSPGNGARFEIYLPRAVEKEEAVSYERLPAISRHGSETILVVEDEDEVRSLASEFLRSAGYSVLTARDGVEALEVSDRLGSSIQLLLTDVVMPRMRGTELAQKLKACFPSLRVVYMSGYLEQDACSGEILEKAIVLLKPFSSDTLSGQIGDAIQNKTSVQA